MARFTALKPDEVTVGRGRLARALREPYVAALREGEAGKVELERGEKPATAKRLLQESAREVSVRIRSSYVEKENAIYWKKMGA
jgi:hypothetical protein